MRFRMRVNFLTERVHAEVVAPNFEVPSLVEDLGPKARILVDAFVGGSLGKGVRDISFVMDVPKKTRQSF